MITLTLENVYLATQVIFSIQQEVAKLATFQDVLIAKTEKIVNNVNQGTFCKICPLENVFAVIADVRHVMGFQRIAIPVHKGS